MAEVKRNRKLKVAPTVIESNKHTDLLPAVYSFQAKPGEYHIVAIGPNGIEIPGSDFSYPPGKSFDKAFASNPKFEVKKKSPAGE